MAQGVEGWRSVLSSLVRIPELNCLLGSKLLNSFLQSYLEVEDLQV